MRMLAIVRSNPRTTALGAIALLSILAGVMGTDQTGRTWPFVVGLLLAFVAVFVALALAADAKEPM